jgi:hypothetical protein
MVSQKYLDVNLSVCSSYGVTAACETALERLGKMKRPPKWLVEKFKAIQEREARLRPHLIEYRGETR